MSPFPGQVLIYQAKAAQPWAYGPDLALSSAVWDSRYDCKFGSVEEVALLFCCQNYRSVGDPRPCMLDCMPNPRTYGQEVAVLDPGPNPSMGNEAGQWQICRSQSQYARVAGTVPDSLVPILIHKCGWGGRWHWAAGMQLQHGEGKRGKKNELKKGINHMWMHVCQNKLPLNICHKTSSYLEWKCRYIINTDMSAELSL